MVKSKRVYIGIILSVLVCLIASLLLWKGSSEISAKGNKYDRLIHTSSKWSVQRTLQEGDASRKQGDIGKALVLYLNAEQKLADDTTSGAVELRVRSCLNRGDIYMEGGNYGEALKAYLKGLHISEGTSKEPHIVNLYKNIAYVYSLFRDYDKNRDFELKGYAKACQYSDSAMMSSLLNSLSRGYVAVRNPVRARHYYKMLDSLDYARTLQERYKKDYTLAMVVRCEGNIQDAINRFHNLALRNKDAQDARYICSVYNELYWIYNEMSTRNDSAEYYLRKCINRVKENHLELMFIDEIKELSNFYKRIGKSSEAGKWRMEYLELIDSLYIKNIRSVGNVSNQQFLYEMEKAESQIDGLWQEKRYHDKVITHQRWIIIGILAAVLGAVLLIWYIVRQNHRLSESYRSLYSLNRTLDQNHRQAITMQSELEEENERLRAELEQFSEKRGEKADSTEIGVLEKAEADQGNKEKYSSSSLSQSQMRVLARQISDAMEQKSCDYCDSDFSLSILAEHVGSNIRYVSQVINHVFEKSFNSYVNEYRIREASRRLAGKDIYANYSIKGIGESVGFKSHSTFVGVFKKITGMTPSVYRKMTLS